MWILPKQLHTSHFVPDTAALILDLAEQSQICEPSLLARSKPSLARTWSLKWKRDSWTQHLSGRILKPSHGQSFVTAWTSSLEVIPASHSQQQANDLDETTLDTSGHISQTEFALCDQESASLKTSKDTSHLDSERLLANWKALVTRLRGEYSVRVKSAHLTRESGSLSWPTANARDWKDSITGTHPPSRPNMSEQTLGQAVSVVHGQAAPVNSSSLGSRQESWATQSTMDHINVVRKPEEEVHQWATPRLGGEEKAETRLARGKDIGLHGQVGAMKNSAKLNPRWVETLMGLPIGWTMPSCSSPLTIAPMNSDCLATESCLPQQPELF